MKNQKHLSDYLKRLDEAYQILNEIRIEVREAIGKHELETGYKKIIEIENNLFHALSYVGDTEEHIKMLYDTEPKRTIIVCNLIVPNVDDNLLVKSNVVR